MAGRMPKNKRYEKWIKQLLEARETGNPQKVKEELCNIIGIAKRFYTVDQLTSWLDFLFSEIDNQPWIVEVLREPYIESGKLSITDLDTPDLEPIDIRASSLKIRNKRPLNLKDNGLNGHMRLVQE